MESYAIFHALLAILSVPPMPLSLCPEGSGRLKMSRAKIMTFHRQPSLRHTIAAWLGNPLRQVHHPLWNSLRKIRDARPTLSVGIAAAVLFAFWQLYKTRVMPASHWHGP